MSFEKFRYLLSLGLLLLWSGCQERPVTPAAPPSASPRVALQQSSADEDEPWCLPGNAADWEAYQASKEESKTKVSDGPPPDLGELVKKLHSPSPDDRLDAIRALGNLGPAAAPAVAELHTALNARHPTVQRDYDLVGFQFKSPVLWALARIGPAAEPAAQDILEIAVSANPDLSPPDYDYQVLAVQALGSIGPGAGDTVEPLLELARTIPTGDARRYYILKSVGQIGTEEARKGLEAFLGGEDITAREVAAKALMKSHPELLEPWFDTFVGENEQLAIRVAGALEYSQDRTEFLIDALSSQHKAAAVESLTRHGPQAASAIPALIELDGVIQREVLVGALRSLDPAGTKSVALIKLGLEDPLEVADAMDLLDMLDLPPARQVLQDYIEQNPAAAERLEHIRELRGLGDVGM
jgi:HEAT repeat protein